MSNVIDMTEYWLGYRHGRGALGFEPPLNTESCELYEEGYYKGYMQALAMHNKCKSEKINND